ncbi:MAG: hypothetical protein G01um10143_744 [Parcubacteria group bacterium Gr01-1014_3]|nr:MAG: hypothetical protein G01um10143_744 [Parcubacteria group bacterium Gr01-1014_3]
MTGFWLIRNNWSFKVSDSAAGIFYISFAAGEQVKVAVWDSLSGVRAAVMPKVKTGNRWIVVLSHAESGFDQLRDFQPGSFGKIQAAGQMFLANDKQVILNHRKGVFHQKKMFKIDDHSFPVADNLAENTFAQFFFLCFSAQNQLGHIHIGRVRDIRIDLFAPFFLTHWSASPGNQSANQQYQQLSSATRGLA